MFLQASFYFISKLVLLKNFKSLQGNLSVNKLPLIHQAFKATSFKLQQTPTNNKNLRRLRQECVDLEDDHLQTTLKLLPSTINSSKKLFKLLMVIRWPYWLGYLEIGPYWDLSNLKTDPPPNGVAIIEWLQIAIKNYRIVVCLIHALRKYKYKTIWYSKDTIAL